MPTGRRNDRRVIRQGTAAVIAALLMTALGACSAGDETGPGTGGAVTSEVTTEQETFRTDLVSAALPQDEAIVLIEQNGYTWRLGTIDGEPQAVTMDYRLDRLTLTVDGGIVTDAVWG